MIVLNGRSPLKVPANGLSSCLRIRHGEQNWVSDDENQMEKWPGTIGFTRLKVASIRFEYKMKKRDHQREI